MSLPSISTVDWSQFEIALGDTAGFITKFAAYLAARDIVDGEQNVLLQAVADWASTPEDTLVPAASGGNEVDDYSLVHWAAKAISSAAGLNMPAIGGSDGLKQLRAKANGSGFELFVFSQLEAALDANGKTFNGSSYRQIAAATPATAATHTFDFANGDYQRVTCPAAGALTLATSGFVSGKVCSFIIELANGGNCTITLPSGWQYSAGGTAPVLTTAGIDTLMLIKDGDDVYSLYVLGYNMAAA
ncbi:MAG: hypothetical protein JKX92_05435 [Porticoccaceae bacterium]|nr:hypothetical protein [Porticoccaceae bacterium]